MPILENFENLSISEECFNEILNLVEEYINEVSDKVIAKVYNKRLDNYKAALKSLKQNPNNKQLFSIYKQASGKLAKNSKLSTNAFTRSRNFTNADITSPKNKQNKVKSARKTYDKSLATADKAKNDYNTASQKLSAAQANLQAQGKAPMSKMRAMQMNKEIAQLQVAKNNAESTYRNADAVARQSRKNYHNTLDATNSAPKDFATLQKHLEYQKTHDDKGNRIP